MKKKIIISICLTISLLAIVFVFSNIGLNGVYRCTMVQTVYKNSDPYLVFRNGKVYGLDINDVNGLSIKHCADYDEKNGKYYFINQLNGEKSEIIPTFTKLNWPLYENELIHLLKSKPLEDELSRVQNPFKQLDFYYEINKYEGKSVLSLLKFW